MTFANDCNRQTGGQTDTHTDADKLIAIGGVLQIFLKMNHVLAGVKTLNDDGESWRNDNASKC